MLGNNMAERRVTECGHGRYDRWGGVRLSRLRTCVTRAREMRRLRASSAREGTVPSASSGSHSR